MNMMDKTDTKLALASAAIFVLVCLWIAISSINIHYGTVVRTSQPYVSTVRQCKLWATDKALTCAMYGTTTMTVEDVEIHGPFYDTSLTREVK